VSLLRIELFIHVAAVVVALGVTFVYPFLQAFSEKNGVAATRFALRFGERLENIVVIPGAILLFIMGLLMIANGESGFKDDMPVWLTIGIVWFLAAFAVAVFVQRKNVKAGIKTLEGVPDDAALPPEYLAVSKRMQMVGGLLGLSVICITFLMVYQPGG
jgi:putative Mn2+ efflux pump MntP